jgi:ubiquinone/menaquinone biosynthesis C-methylase UbiE
MNSATLDLLCHPHTGERLRLESDGQLQSDPSGDAFEIKHGIPVLLPDGDVTGSNRQYRDLYDKIARGYDLPQQIWGYLRYGGIDRVIEQYLKYVDVQPGDRVLEVSVGTGTNVWFLPSHGEYYGLDISWGMLRQCQRNARRHKRQIELVCGSAEHLPFREAVFDCVFHVGGINFFNDKERAIRELLRVAKSGTRIVIVDEEEEYVKGVYERIPFVRRYFHSRREPVTAPVELIPPGIRDLRVERALDRKLYVLCFVKE